MMQPRRWQIWLALVAAVFVAVFTWQRDRMAAELVARGVVLSATVLDISDKS